MKLVYITAGLIFLMAVLLPGILGLGIRKIPSGFQPSLDNSQSIDKTISIKQSFRSKENFLSAIGLSIKNPYFRNSKDLFFNLFDDQNRQVRTIKLNGKNIADGNFLIINFDPVGDSQNKYFSFTLNAPDSNSAEALEVYHSQQNREDGGEYNVNHEVKSGQISFVSYYSRNNPVANLIFIYRNWLVKLFQDLFFAIFYLLLIGGITVYLFYAFLVSKKHLA